MKKCLLVLYALTSAAFAFARNDSLNRHRDFGNTVTLSATDFHIPHIFKSFSLKPYDHNPQNQLGVYYTRKIYHNWRLSIGYSKWNDFNYFVDKDRLVRGDDRPFYPGQLEFRSKAKMVDVIPTYRYNEFARHKINFGIGVSYLKENNLYIDSIIYFPADYIVYASWRTKNYLGIVPVLSYDYLFLKNRCSVGAVIRCRKYYGLYSSQIDFGFQLGLNF